MYNINSGYGLHQMIQVAKLGGGKIRIVGKSSVVNKDMIVELFKPDQDGQIRYFETVDAAVSSCTAGAGDKIYVLPGHTEAITTATNMVLDIAGVSIIGLGNGLNRPTFTFGAAAGTITVSAANVSFSGCHFIANFDNVASAFTLAAAKDFVLENNTFLDNSNALHFLSILVTNTTDEAAAGLTVRGNTWKGMAIAPNAFVSILGDADRVTIEDNDVVMAATNDVGHFLTLAAKDITTARVRNNTCVVTGATTATVGIFLTGSGTSCTGIVKDNCVASLDTTTELLATAGTGLVYFNNLYTGNADASGYLLPVADEA